jgi:DNA-binding MarR family transcriptional regulator
MVADLVVTVFRLNGSLIDAGNRLVGDIGLTSAWWQVLGALSLSPAPLPVAHIARNMGLSRQSVQRTADLLAEKGLVRFTANPHHQRAKLVVLTPEGIASVAAAEQRQRPWARELTAGLSTERIAAALDVLTQLDLHLSKAASAAGENSIEDKESSHARVTGTGPGRVDSGSTERRE